MFIFQNTYCSLPAHFYAPVKPQAFKKAKMIRFNEELAIDLGHNEKDPESITKYLSGQKIIGEQSPIALAYAGHQFGHFVPQLGDGRAVLLGEVLSKDNKRFDIQLKGSGQTPFSRAGDGKSSLGPVLREYIVSEAMFHLGIPTTRALAAVATNEDVFRQTVEPGGVFTRVASSHIRIGTFEFFASKGDFQSVKLLADYTISRHYENINSNNEDKYLNLITEYAKKQSKLISKWMSVGFIHGVMNTDNMALSGETIDFGPCAFLDEFKFKKVFSSIDRNGRYAYDNQIPIGQWNLYRLAECLISLIQGEQEQEQEQAIEKVKSTLKKCVDIYDKDWLSEMALKFGISEAIEEDRELINDWLNYLEENELDFTISFRELTEDINSHPNFTQRILNRHDSNSLELMNRTNPIYIPRNHQIEKVIQDAFKGNYETFNKIADAIKTPFSRNERYSEFEEAPQIEERVSATFCGT